MRSIWIRIPDMLLKRLFDIFFSFVGLLLLFPIIIVAWVMASFDTCSNGFFIQKRIGLHGRPFSLLKIKTMRCIDGVETTITSSKDVRITKSGAFLRRSKIDELPQLWNVLIGQMSFVGPRPDVPGYADKLIGKDLIVLSMRPGITGPASLKYRNEEEILSNQDNPEKYNDEVIWPDKVRINRKYIVDYSFKKDLSYIWETIIG